MSENSNCLSRVIPLAIWGHRLNSDSLHAAVKLVVLITNSNESVIEACYLYCFAISSLLRDNDAKKTYQLTRDEAARRAGLTGNSTLLDWFADLIEADTQSKLPLPSERPTTNIKIPFVLTFYYLFKGYSYQQAIRDILGRGGDTKTNAAIVGGMFGAQGIQRINQEVVSEVLNFQEPYSQQSIYNLSQGDLVTKLINIVDQAPKYLKVTLSNQTFTFDQLKAHYRAQLGQDL